MIIDFKELYYKLACIDLFVSAGDKSTVYKTIEHCIGKSKASYLLADLIESVNELVPDLEDQEIEGDN